MKINNCPILKVNIAVTDMDSILEYICKNLSDLSGKYICVSNVHTTVMAFRDENYRRIQNSAVLALPDGKPLSVVSRHRGFSNAKRVPGPDLMAEIFSISAKNGFRHYFYGSTQETLDRLKIELERKYQGINIVGMYSPPFRKLSDLEDMADVSRINSTNPDFVWVGLGAPKQEIWMNQHDGKINGLMIGVGAGFDFHAGTSKRAPKWIQELCLEWLYRLVQNPKRLLRRYASTNLSFIWNTMKEGHAVKNIIRREHPKIAMIGHKRIPSREGGVEIVVEELSKRMVDKGIRVDAYNRKGAHVSGRQFAKKIGKYYLGIRIITIPTFETKSLNAIVYAFFATIRALFGEYNVIHYHAEGSCIMLPIAHLFGIKTVVTIHGLDWNRSKWSSFASKMLKYGEKCAVRYANEIIVLSNNMRLYFLNEYQKETIYISNGINAPQILEPNEINNKWGLKKDEYILFLARIVPEKGAHYLINAYMRLYEEYPHLHRKKLVIAGGSSHSAEYYSKLRDMSVGCEEIIFTDYVGGNTLEELFSNAYIFVLPSDVEGMAIGLLEAMSYGNCCLVSDIPENVEVVDKYAEVFQHSNVGSLKEKLKLLIQDRVLVEKYKRESSKYILEKYNWDRVVEETVKIYSE